MGARTTWEIRQYPDTPSIYLYSHWGGGMKWPDTVQALAAAEPRWNDPAYGARIFISQIVGNQWNEETGFGIIAGMPGDQVFEEEYFSVVVDFVNQSVTAGDQKFSFKDFLTAVDNTEALVESYWNA